MNDLTKEELIYLYDGLDSNYSELKNIPLMNKIQLMIENYCDHDWRKGAHLFNDIYCTKCEKYFPVNNDE